MTLDIRSCAAPDRRTRAVLARAAQQFGLGAQWSRQVVAAARGPGIGQRKGHLFVPHACREIVCTTQREGRFQAGDRARGIAGLAINVTQPGSRSWVLRYTVDGRCRDLGFGGDLDVTLADAKTAACCRIST